MNVFDRFVALWNPQAALRRANARAALRLIEAHGKRRYEAAAKSRRTSGWRATGADANAEALPALDTLRNRSRDLVRNNPWAARAVQAIVSNTVGTGIMAKFADEKLQEAWKPWANSTDCDADDTHDFYGLQALAMRTVADSGEVLIRRRIRSSADGLKVPLQIQVIEPDHLVTDRDGTTKNGNRVVGGVEFDKIGRRVAYYLRRGHPGAVDSDSTVSRVPADDVLHLYRCDRPGQVRGVPWGTSVMLRLRDLDDYEDAYLLRNKLANCMTAFVYQSDAVDATDSDDTPILEGLEPGAIEILPNGKDIKFSTPPTVDGYGEYTRAVLKAIAAGYGITYEALTGDLSQVNFSSGRMGWIEFGRNIAQWQWGMLVPGFCDPVASWFAQVAAPARKADRVWTAPRREMIQPDKELAAAKDAVRSGFMSLSEVSRTYGYDAGEMLAELASDLAMARKLGLKLDIDPSNDKPAATAATGATHAPSNDDPQAAG